MRKVKLKPGDKLISKCIVMSNGCWEWLGYRNKCGYGRLTFRGKKTLAPRMAWMVFVAEIPDGMKVLHRCDNPPCINPEHLFLGSDRDNVADCIKKGRFRGIENSPLKLGNTIGRYGRAGKPRT